MKIYLSENIRKFRKQKNMTQEQFSEAMGVSVGAVSKWESGQMNPEIGMIVKIADYFGLSVDYLLGYTFKSQSLTDTVAMIKSFNAKKDYITAKESIPKALLKYPNDFDIVYHSGITLSNLGWERNDTDAINQAKKLLEHACTLIEQNKDPDISLGSIKTRIAIILSSERKFTEAIDLLMKYNVNGVNNARIGNCYVAMNKYDQALTVLSENYLDNLVNIYMCEAGMCSCFSSMNRYSEAVEMVMWLKHTLKALEYEDKPSYLVKMGMMLDTMLAMLYYAMKDKETARIALWEVAEKARLFDSNPDFSCDNIRFYSGKEHTFYDDIGQSAFESVENMLRMNDDEKDRDGLIVIWKEILDEK